ncbi:ABC transporter substrate-binding protein [Alcaligenaceae bacterium CGII-47]|nr:ABC transporter substrate-binding protein [Alcaligenaceae bacterium CGII-47]
MVETQALHGLVGTLEFRHWKNPDQLRVLLAKKEIDFSATPVNLPAIMANRGSPVRLLNVSVWGILWFISRNPEVRSVSDLAGRTLVSTFQRDLPSILLDRLTEARGLTGTRAVQRRHTRDAQDAMALILTGQAENALLVEPAVSMLLAQNIKQGGAPLYRVQSLEAAWSETFPDSPDLPQAGIMVNAHLADDRALSRAVDEAYTRSAQWCSAHPAECAAIVHKHLNFLPADAIEASIRVTRLDSRPASAVRPALESLYRLIQQHDPDAIGGHLPNTDFYGS